MLYYVVCGVLLIGYLKKKKNENTVFCLLAIGIIGGMLFGIFFTPTELIKSIAESQARGHYESIYRNTSFATSEITLLSNGLYHVRVLVFAGNFGVGALNETVNLTLFHKIMSYSFAGINVLAILAAIVIIIKDNLTLPKSDGYRDFKRQERQRSLINQMLSIIVINVLIILFLSREEFIIYAADSLESAKDAAYYIGITNPYRMAVDAEISTQFGNFKIGANIYILLLYLILLGSAFAMILGKKYRRFKTKKYNYYCFVSFGLFLISMIGLCFSENLANINIGNLASGISPITTYTYFFAYSSTNVFLIYRIISCVTISGFYAFIIYHNFLKIKSEKIANNNKVNKIIDLTKKED